MITRSSARHCRIGRHPSRHDLGRRGLKRREAIQQFRAHLPDITIMDLQMPEMNGLDAMATIRGEFPDARIIVLTTYTGNVQILRALKSGAYGYLLKNTFTKELLVRSAPSMWEEDPFP
jgi:DNA-binding NarL/FixJ family response regulator